MVCCIRFWFSTAAQWKCAPPHLNVIPLLVSLLRPFIKVLSTPKRAGQMITELLTDASGRTGVYYDESGRPMHGSALVRDPKFQDRVVAETRALLSTVPG